MTKTCWIFGAAVFVDDVVVEAADLDDDVGCFALLDPPDEHAAAASAIAAAITQVDRPRALMVALAFVVDSAF